MRAITEHSPTTLPIPAFQLYGEATGEPEQLHWESIAARSRLHDWQIRPHRHAGLYQLLLLQHGGVQLVMDGRDEHAQGPLLVWVTPLCVHGFHFQVDVQGHVLTLAAPLVQRWMQRTPLLAGGLAHPFSLPLPQPAPLLAALQGLAEAHADVLPGRDVLLDALATQVLVLAARFGQTQRPAAAPVDRGVAIVKRYLALLEEHYREHLPLQHYADTLGLGVGRLGQLCRQHTGMPAQRLLQQRLMLEAKRSLVFTSMTVQQVAAHTGFSDAAYFSRFFARHAGCPPQRYREQQAQGTAPSPAL